MSWSNFPNSNLGGWGGYNLHTDKILHTHKNFATPDSKSSLSLSLVYATGLITHISLSAIRDLGAAYSVSGHNCFPFIPPYSSFKMNLNSFLKLCLILLPSNAAMFIPTPVSNCMVLIFLPL